MKKRMAIILLLGGLAAGCLCVWKPFVLEAPENQPQPSVLRAWYWTMRHPIQAYRNRVALKARLKQRAENIERGQDEWRTPIEFYGKVVDQNEQPVAGAEIDFGTNDLSPTGSSNYKGASDTNGLFSIRGIKGKLLIIKVNKEGYYVSKRDNDSFYYAGMNVNFIPDFNNPVIFHLKKKGQAEPLIATSGRIKIPLHGTPVEIDLGSGKIVPTGQGQLKLECLSDYKNKTNGVFHWKLSLSIPDGGIMQSTNEFDFEASEQGYEKIYEIQMPGPKEISWTQMLDRNFFLKLPNGNFGRISISFISYNGVLRFQSFINPSGSRNLEFDPEVQPKQTHFE